MGIVGNAWKTAKYVRRVGGVKAAATMVRDAPKYAQLYRRLFADERVPKSAKAVLVGAGVFAVSPLNIPNFIPVIGALDDLAIMMLANGYFMKKVPADLLAEHRQAVGLA
jgi:uncharacterized membrane protein YkvA (DUF1232 family)